MMSELRMTIVRHRPLLSLRSRDRDLLLRGDRDRLLWLSRDRDRLLGKTTNFLKNMQWHNWPEKPIFVLRQSKELQKKWNYIQFSIVHPLPWSPLAPRPVQFPFHFGRDRFEMHKVAETASRAFAHFVLTTARFAEVGDGRKFGVNWRAVVPPVIQISNGFGGIFLFPEFDVDVADLTRRLDR